MEVLICFVRRNTWSVFRGRISSRAYGILVVNFRGYFELYVLCWICLNGVGFDLLVIQGMEVHIKLVRALTSGHKLVAISHWGFHAVEDLAFCSPCVPLLV